MTEVLEKMFDGVKFVIERTTWQGLPEVTVKAPATVLRTLPDVPDFVLEQDARFIRWVALDKQGREVADDYNLKMLQKWGLRSYFKELGVEQCRKQLETLGERGASLRLKDFSTGHFLGLFENARKAVRKLSWGSSPSTDAAVTALRAVERHLERIENEPSQVLLEDILSGAAYHRDHSANVKLLADVVTLSVRSGGRIEMPAEETLKELYELALDGASKVRAALEIDLALSQELFVPDGWQSDNTITWAPETFDYVDGSRSGSFNISYGMGERDGKVIPMASLRIPLSLFKNKRVVLPSLPHGIALYLELTLQEKVVVSGFEDRIVERVRKYEGGRRRGGIRGGGAAFAVEEPSTPPPWAMGQSARTRPR